MESIKENEPQMVSFINPNQIVNKQIMNTINKIISISILLIIFYGKLYSLNHVLSKTQIQLNIIYNLFLIQTDFETESINSQSWKKRYSNKQKNIKKNYENLRREDGTTSITSKRITNTQSQYTSINYIIGNNQINDVGWVIIAEKLHEIQQLYLSGNKIGTDGFDATSLNQKNLKQIYLECNNINCIQSLKRGYLSQVIVLSLYNNHIQSTDALNSYANNELNELYLSNNWPSSWKLLQYLYLHNAKTIAGSIQKFKQIIRFNMNKQHLYLHVV